MTIGIYKITNQMDGKAFVEGFLSAQGQQVLFELWFKIWHPSIDTEE